MGITKEAITDRETSMYTDGFEEMDSVQDIYEKSPAEAYLDTAEEEIKDAMNDYSSGRPAFATVKTVSAPMRAWIEAQKASLN